jgi:hypothetical protein
MKTTIGIGFMKTTIGIDFMEWQCLWFANYTALPLHKINAYGCLNRILLVKISRLYRTLTFSSPRIGFITATRDPDRKMRLKLLCSKSKPM